MHSLPRAQVEFHSFKNRLRSLLVNAAPRTLCVMLPAQAIVCAIAFGCQIFDHEPSSAAAIVRAWIWNLQRWRSTKALRSAVQGRRVLSDRELWDRVLVPTKAWEFARLGRLYRQASRSHSAHTDLQGDGMRQAVVSGEAPPRHPEAKAWDTMADLDPLWAVLSDPQRKHGRWTWDDFMATGREHVSWILQEATALERVFDRKRALDFGCGVGRIAGALACHFNEVVGVDISRGMVDLAKERHANIANMYFVVNNRSSLDWFPDQSFDLVVSDRVLQHYQSVDDIVLSLRELLRVTKRDGLLCFQLPHRLGGAYRTLARWRPYELLLRMGVPPAQLYRRLGLHGMRLRAIREGDVVSILESHGGKVLHVERTADGGRTYFVGRRG